MRFPTSRARGFTLVELLVVVAVLATVAALVIPRLGFAEERAAAATAAVGAGQLVSNLETYKVSTRSYPLGLDSLLADTDADGTPDELYQNLWWHAAGPPTSPGFGPRVYLAMQQLDPTGTDSYEQSLGHAFSSPGGSVYFHDHDTDAATPVNDSGILRRDVTFAATDLFAFVDDTTAGFITPIIGQPLMDAAGYPDGLPAGTRLVAFGVSSRSGLIGETMATAPLHTENDNGSYARYLAIYAVYANGKSADLKVVVDSQGVGPGGNIASYEALAPNHD